jgi:chromosome segregation ATPase
LTTSELQEKNKEIDRLTELINSLRVDRYSISSEPPRFSFDYLYETFNDLKFQQAMEIKKQSQQKIDQLMGELETMTNSKTLKQLEQLKVQMAIVAEKQQITDSALNRCTELCAYTLDHLQELTQFLTALLQNKQIRESLSEASLHNIQNIIEKSLDLSTRQSMGNFSFNDISSLDVLVNAARQSIVNIREVQQTMRSTNKGIQTSVACDSANTSTITDYEELKRINQLLEDEIVEIKNTMRVYEKKSNEYKSEIVELKSVKDELNEKIEKSESAMRMLEDANRNLQLTCDDYKVEVDSLARKFG